VKEDEVNREVGCLWTRTAKVYPSIRFLRKQEPTPLQEEIIQADPKNQISGERKLAERRKRGFLLQLSSFARQPSKTIPLQSMRPF
jgi:hypothetical protein